jgi:GT2 family glycosyltransferase
MATYNGERHIKEQLDSLARQSLLPLELVVTDDGSTDATLAIVADFAQTAPFPVRVHRNVGRLGYVKNTPPRSVLLSGSRFATRMTSGWTANCRSSPTRFRVIRMYYWFSTLPK